MSEWVIASDEGVIEDGFYSREEAEKAIAERYDPEDELSAHPAEEYAEEEDEEDEDEDC